LRTIGEESPTYSGRRTDLIHRRFEVLAPHLDEGEIIRGDVRYAEGPAPRTAVVVVHGFKGYKDWGFFPHLCEQLALGGHAVVSFNFSRNGVGDDLDSFSELERFATNTYSRELDDLRWMVDAVMGGEFLSRRPERVGLIGHSRGGGAAVLHARNDERLAALVTWAAVARYDRWTEETRAEWREAGRVYILNSRTGQQMPLDVSLMEDFETNAERLSVLDAASEVAAPWLVVHGRDDLTVAESEARELVRASGRAKLVLVEKSGHTFEVGHPFQGTSPQLTEAIDATTRHFAKHLGRD